MKGKIARLPSSIRHQLNLRLLENSQPHNLLLDWLNSLPETQALLHSDFDGQPISKQNLHHWSQHGFRHWKLHHDALQFANAHLETDPDDNLEDSPALSSTILLDKLLHWLALRYAALAETLPSNPDDPEADLRRLRRLSADILALHRAELSRSRVSLQERKVALLEEEAEVERAKREAWRKGIGEWHKTLRATMPELAQYLPPEEPEPPKPAGPPPGAPGPVKVNQGWQC